jgi:DNA invertase Pin-like site-specific DNA recombinase
MKTNTKTTEERRRPFLERANEAAELIQRLVDAGMTPEQIAEASRVSERTAYRWWKEGRSPHPILLDALRKLAAKKGVAA